MMACCSHDDHDYCCDCTLSEADRVQQMIEDVLDGTYYGEVGMPSILETLGHKQAQDLAEAIVAVLKHEDVV